VLAGESGAARIGVDLRSMVPWAEWPMPAETSPVRVALSLNEQTFVLQPGQGSAMAGWQLAQSEALASESQPLRLSLSRPVSGSDLPWAAMLSWALGVAVLLLAARAVLRQRADRRRAQALLRMGQVERQAVLVEMAGGIGQELGSPLQQTLANLKAAQQVLDEDPPDLLTSRLAVREAIAHAQRAAQTVNRLQQVATQPDLSERIQVLDPAAAVRQALDLLEPEARRRGVQVSVDPGPANLRVFADPGAVAQILHNLLLNALQSLDQVQISDRELTLRVAPHETWGRITVRDSGPGIPTDVLPHVFEPFFTTREGALGLGLTHSESLALAMGGTLTAFNHAPRGAEFCLSLPVASMP
jgi:C4-dicarboxylate-specific signal transduction histidine kinase